eukprot:9684451-Alexandrium_andersonii.AAC.1
MMPAANDGEAIIAGGIRARVPAVAVGAAGLCMCSERLAHVRWGCTARSGGPNCTCIHLPPRTSFSSPLVRPAPNVQQQ